MYTCNDCPGGGVLLHLSHVPGFVPGGGKVLDEIDTCIIYGYKLHSLLNKKLLAKRIMVKTTSRSDRPWSASFCVIIYRGTSAKESRLPPDLITCK